MFEKFPSLLGFQPKFYLGGPGAVHLPLLYDLVANTKPRLVVALGFGDGQGFFALCQAMQELELEERCLAVRRDDGDESDDARWLAAKALANESYRDLAELRSGSVANVLSSLGDTSINLLLVDDCDSGTELQHDLALAEPKLAPDALILFHGSQLERNDSPREAWAEWTRGRAVAEFDAGIGLGLARSGERTALLPELFGEAGANGMLPQLYELAREKIEAVSRVSQADRDRDILQIQKAALSSSVATAAEAQRIMDHQGQMIADLEQKFEPLQRDRAKAQLVMDAQAEELQSWVASLEKMRAERDKLKAQVKQQKAILQAAKKACRKGGKCFQALVPKEKKPKRAAGERLIREVQRWPRQLRSLLKPAPAPEEQLEHLQEKKELPKDRYEAWIEEHEPDAAALEEQRRLAGTWNDGPKISLLLPVLDTPPNFLEEMLSSIAEQTYSNWELCLVDAASKNSETLAVLSRWESREPRIRVERLAENLGIAENTNRAFGMAGGDFVICIDHDDLLPPFALYEMARAIQQSPQGEIFYSDEDRLTEDGKRHSPFFKPEWSPALLTSFMYIGHLTAYRRELIEKLGGWRKEFDLSQDYDLALRATDEPREIRHVPHVLYHWREHAASGSTGGKPDARKTNLAALADATKRRGNAATIIEYPTANRARLEFRAARRVSIIIPTDSPERGRRCIEHLAASTAYRDYEVVIVTNSSLAEILKMAAPPQPTFRFVPFDEPFNFSAKCNLGAAAATGDRLIFYNDDVETEQRGWIENLIESLEDPGVGAVSPKLLYTDGKIQHAGLVTGVRGLVGTAFHQQPADTTMHANMAQSLREVSALSGACLAMRRDDFERLGGWDTVNTPISGSDYDLCFRIREAGLRCLYTPFTTLHHAGHVSLGHAEQKIETPPPHDKSWVYLLKRWAGFTTHDPYFTDNMRDWLFADSPTPIMMTGRNESVVQESLGDLRFVSHDLSFSGAPMMFLYAALAAQSEGYFVVLMSPEDGPLREKFEAAGIPVIVDPLLKKGHESFERLAQHFDCVIANTIFGAPIVHGAQRAGVPVLWWLHETLAGAHFLREDPKLRSALPVADVVLAPSEWAAIIYRPFRDRPVECLRNAIPDLAADGEAQRTKRDSDPLEFLLLGTIERRKGQDVLLDAVAALPAELRSAAKFRIIGRVHDKEFGQKVAALARDLSNVELSGPVSHGEAVNAIRRADVLVCASRDEAMPVTIMEAMSLGKAIVSTAVGEIPEVLKDGENGLVVRPEAPTELERALRSLMTDRALLQRLSRAARVTYEKQFSMERFGAEFCNRVREAMGSAAVAGAGKS
jgi:GT2 family glycosyltransferase/glycosyltransferase involved in cell wall biosynthesis